MITLCNDSDFISFRHHTFEKPRGTQSVALTECGPRFELKLYQIRYAGSHRDGRGSMKSAALQPAG